MSKWVPRDARGKEVIIVASPKDEVMKVLEENPLTILFVERYNKKTNVIEQEIVVTSRSIVQKTRSKYRKRGYNLEKWDGKNVSYLDDYEKEARELKSSLSGLKSSLKFAKESKFKFYTAGWFVRQKKYIRETEEKLASVREEIRPLLPDWIDGVTGSRRK